MEDVPFLLRSVLVEHYKNHLTYQEMSCLLQTHHGYFLSKEAIRKRIKSYGCPKRRGPTLHDADDVRRALELELEEQPITVGYRHMTNVLQHKGIHVRRDTVMRLMKETDPIGAEFRRRRRIKRKVYTSFGPNHVWHTDGYDKLKPYGFAVHGCIDGYSRRIMWLNVAHTNNNPRTVALNYVQCVDSVKGCPVILQGDPGTENNILGAIQCTFRQQNTDCFAGIRSFRIVRSVFNQRIEAWWSMFRRQKSQWWMDFFKDLEMSGAYHKGNEVETFCLRYSFMSLIQKELDTFAYQWNNHYISKSKRATCPGGRPIVLYSLPANNGVEDCLCEVSQEDVDWSYGQCTETTISGSREFDDFAAAEHSAHNTTAATTDDEALRQYFDLCDAAQRQGLM